MLVQPSRRLSARSEKDRMKSRQKVAPAQSRSFCPLSCSVLLAVLGLGGCASWDRPALHVQEAPAPRLLGAKDIDPAMRERIERAIGRNSD